MTQSRSAPKLGEPLGAAALAALRAMQRRCGEQRSLRDLGIPRNTYARALAGLGLRHATVAFIESRLRALGHLPST
jgi:hypothetical protein